MNDEVNWNDLFGFILHFTALKNTYLFIWLHWVFVSACGLSCPEACGILIPQPGIEPASPALEGRFLTTGPTRKFLTAFYFFSSSHKTNICSLHKIFKI